MKGCRALLDAEISNIKQVLTHPRDYCLFVLGLKTGFRIKELLSIRVKDVLQFGNITSHVTVTRSNMKGSHASRTVALHPEAGQCVLKLINEYDLKENDFLFQSRKGINQAISRVQAYRILKSAYNACQLQGKCGTHSLRKSLAKRIYEASGKDLLVTQRALGHVSLSSTQSYLDTNSEIVDALILNMK